MSRNVQFIIDAEGNKTALILPVDEYEHLMEDLHLARVYEESRDEPRRPFRELVEELRQAGEIDV